MQCDQSFQCNDSQKLGSGSVTEKSALCSATAENSEDSASFYLRFKENEDPQKPNGWDSSGETYYKVQLATGKKCQ